MIESGCESDLSHPVYVVPIPDKVVPQLGRVIVQHLFDGREACDQAGVVGVLEHRRRTPTIANCSQQRPNDGSKCDRRAYKNVVTAQRAARS